MATLGDALTEGRLEERLKILSQPQRLIIDEIGYLSLDRQGANLFFQLSRAATSATRSSLLVITVSAPGAKYSAIP